MEPINYLAQVADPFVQAAQGLQLGAGMAELQQKQAIMAQQQRQQQLAMQEQARFFTNPNPTMRDAARYASLLTPEQSKAFLPFMEGISKEKQQGILKSTGQTLSALQLNPEIGINKLKQDALAARNSGDEEDAALFERLAEAIIADPVQGSQTAFKALVQSSAGIPGAKEFYESIDKGLTTARAEAKAPEELRTAVATADKAVADAVTAQATATNAAEKAAADAAKATADANKAKVQAQYAEQVEIAGLNKTNWDIQNLRSQIGDRSARLNLDTQKTAADVAEKMSSLQKNLNDIPADTRKLINESAVLASTSKQSADQFNDLAKRLDESGGGYGVFSSASDFLKKGAGFQGGMTQLRQEYTRLRNTAAIKSLPPGPATDKDIAMALKGFPSDNASAGDLSSFLRGMAKLQDVDASINNAKTDWLAQNNGTLTRAKNTFVAGDYATKPGETFNDFSQRIVGDVSKKYRSPEQIADERRQQAVAQIPTKGTPSPTQQVDVRSQADAILRGGQ
jgi:hypothetical protein